MAPRKKKRPQPVLTPEQENYKEIIAMHRRLLEDAELNLQHALDRCKHVIDGEQDEHAACVICRQDFGWWCPQSPDHTCHYETEWEAGKDTGMVELITGEKVVPKNDAYGFLCCFCGDDSERK